MASSPSMTSRKIWTTIRRVWITAGIAFTVVFVGWSLIAYRANAEGSAATVSDSLVTNVRSDGIWEFLPPDGATGSSKGLLFFPGALVDPAAYAPLARAV